MTEFTKHFLFRNFHIIFEIGFFSFSFSMSYLSKEKQARRCTDRSESFVAFNGLICIVNPTFAVVVVVCQDPKYKALDFFSPNNLSSLTRPQAQNGHCVWTLLRHCPAEITAQPLKDVGDCISKYVLNCFFVFF